MDKEKIQTLSLDLKELRDYLVTKLDKPTYYHSMIGDIRRVQEILEILSNDFIDPDNTMTIST